MTIKAAGRWAWWNQYIQGATGRTGEQCLPHCIERAKEAKLDGVIVKAGYLWVMEQFQRAGIRVGVDVYANPYTSVSDADMLVQGIRNGAEFAIVNAEHEWEQPDSGEQMRRLCSRFRNSYPDIELYASVDTRGGRMLMPYQQVLSRYITGWMPMIYPKAFRPSMPEEFVHQAFKDCIDGKDFGGKPVLPTIQTYDGMGRDAIIYEIVEAKERGFPGYQAYTIGHATDAEWAVIVNDAPQEEEEDEMKDSWLDSTIVGLDGGRLLFNVLQADMSFNAESMTYRRHMTLRVLGFLESDHSHMATVRLNMG